MTTTLTTPTPSPSDDLDAMQLMGVNEVARLLDSSPRSVWRYAALSAAGVMDFPRPVELGDRLKKWLRSEVLEYGLRLAKERR